MNSETKQCQNCKKDFTIEPEDFEFYEKIKVPAPTFCPECRLIRRLSCRNERTLYKRKCDATQKDIISIYSPEKQIKVYDKTYWWSDKWDPLDYGKEYNFSLPFFKQFFDLMREVPQTNLIGENNVNSEYVNAMNSSKDCYLIFGGGFNENVSYGARIFSSKDSLDLYFCDKMDLSCEDVICQNSYRLFYSQNCENCTNSYSLYNCRNCSNCFGCVGLRNRQYNIFNVQYPKEEYSQRIEEMALGGFENLSKYKKLFKEFKLKFPNKYGNLLRTYNSTGDNITDANNVKDSYDVLAGGSENCKYAFWSGRGMKDAYDCQGGSGAEVLYEGVSVAFSVARIFFSHVVWGSYDVFYSFDCHNSFNLFACIGLRNKQYCILNKQYTPESYKETVERIKEHMNSMPYIDSKGRVYKYGEFFSLQNYLLLAIMKL